MNSAKPSVYSKGLPHFNAAHGATLPELLIGMVFFGLVILVANSLLVDSFNMSARASAQGTIDSLQTSGMHLGRSSRILYEELVITDSSELAKCLKRKGAGCMAFAAGGFKPFAAKGFEELNGIFSETGGRCDGVLPTDLCPIQRTTRYRILCSQDTSCDAILVRVDTTYKKLNGNTPNPFVDRSGTVQVPGLALVSREAIDFACAEVNILAGIDYPTLSALCTPFTGVNASPLQEPLRWFATEPASDSDWQQLAKSQCASFGFKNIGLGNNQPQCGNPE
ncbi:MAG: hypothetical protein RJB66_902 [Pseudomonadota bacterium]